MSDARSTAARRYLEDRVRSLSPEGLIALLYETLVRELRSAASSLDRKDAAGKGVALSRALGILGELRASLSHERGGEVAKNLERLYAYWTGRITEASATLTRAPLDPVIAQVETLRETWNEGVSRAARAAGREEEASSAAGEGAPLARTGTR